MSILLVDLSYSTSSARGQASAAHDVLSTTETENTVRLRSSEKASGRHGHTFCSDLVFLHWNNGLRAGMGMVENMEADPDTAKEKTLNLSERKDNALIRTRSSEVYSCVARCADQFRLSVSGRSTHF